MSSVIALNDVVLPGSGYMHIADFVPLELPITAGLRGLYRFGTSLELSKRNLADPDAPLAPIGSPTINVLGASLSNSHCFDTGLVSTPDMTMISIAKMIQVTSTAAGAALVSSAVIDGVARGDTLAIFGTTTPDYRVRATGGYTSGWQNSDLITSGATAGNWNFFGARITSAAEVQSVYGRDGLALQSSTAVDPGDRSTYTGRTLRIGGAYATYSGSTEHLLTAIYDQALTVAQLQSILDYLRQEWAPAVGVTTL